MLKRYLVFCWDDKHAAGGFNDLLWMCDTYEQALECIHNQETFTYCNRCQIVDTHVDGDWRNFKQASPNKWEEII